MNLQPPVPKTNPRTPKTLWYISGIDERRSTTAAFSSDVKAGLQLQRWLEGTVRFTLTGSEPPADVTPDWFRHRVTGPVYLVGREKSPTLANVSRKRARVRFPLLTWHRVVLLDSAAGVGAVTTTLLSAGRCVDNDAYLFPAEGGWLAYVGHHHELVVYVPRGAR